MRVLRGFGMWVLAAGVALTAGAAWAQSSQGNSGSNNGGYSGGSNGGYGGGSGGGYSSGQGSYSTGQGSSSTGQGGYSAGQGGSGTGMGHNGGVSPSTVNNMGVSDVPLSQGQMEEQQTKARNADRQKQLVSDTQKLVELANELQAEVGRSTKDTLSLDVIRKADEIDKLARSVRDKMKNAN